MMSIWLKAFTCVKHNHQCSVRTRTATPAGPLPSYHAVSMVSVEAVSVARLIADSILSLGRLAALPRSIAYARRKFVSGLSPPAVQHGVFANGQHNGQTNKMEASLYDVAVDTFGCSSDFSTQLGEDLCSFLV